MQTPPLSNSFENKEKKPMQEHINFCNNTVTDLETVQAEMNALFQDTVIPSDLWPQMQFARNCVSKAVKSMKVATMLAEGIACSRGYVK